MGARTRRAGRAAPWLLGLTVAAAGAFGLAQVAQTPVGPSPPRVPAVAAPVPGGGADGRVPVATPVASSPAPPLAAPSADESADRLRQVRSLLDARAAALLARDRSGFLAGVDPQARAFRERQAALFDALVEVPLGEWAYELDPTRASDATGLRDRYGVPVWVPQVTLRYGFAGLATDPALAAQVLTFVQRDGRWWLASDSDLDDQPVRTARSLWDSGPVVAVRGARSLVLGHPESRPVLEQLAAEVDRAVPRVSAVWGEQWDEQVVVLVPRDEAEMALVVGQELALDSIAAVATAQLAGGPDRYEPVGDRVVVHPRNYPGLGSLGRRVVLSHEVTHVAAREASGPAVPVWLVEGLAEHVAYGEERIALSRAAPRTAAAVRAGRLPEALPTAEEFRGEAMAEAYERSWLAVTHLADTWGRDALLRLYRQIGQAEPGGNGDAVVRGAFADVLGLTPEQFVAGWRDDLLRRFA